MSEINSNLILTSKQINKRKHNDDQFIDHSPISSTDKNETQRTYPLSNFKGSLLDACVTAFDPSTISDRRPVLVYISRDRDSFRKKLCEKSLYSQAIIDYLNANYVFWSYKIASNSDRFKLFKIWEEMFSTQFYEDFPDEKYPFIIGVMRLFEHNTNGIITSEYQFRTLVEGNTLVRTQVTVNNENLLTELNLFKEKCHENEKNPIFSFVEKTGLSWEIILEIAKYLSLNDTINAFSIDILSLLDHPQAKFHLSDPSGLFIKKILPKINYEKFVSLQFKTKSCSMKTLNFLPPSKKLISITFHDLQDTYLLRDYLIFFPNWTRLCLYYDRETNFQILENILYEFQHQLKRFEIHCPGLYICYSDMDTRKDIENKMIMVEYFLLDISLQSSRPMYGHIESNQTRYFMAETKLIKTMPNIRYLHLIIKNDDVQRVCFFTIWEFIVYTLSKLKKIRIDVCGSTSENKESLINQALKLQTTMRAHRESFKFQIRLL